jgi:hypothetical protein
MAMTVFVIPSLLHGQTETCFVFNEAQYRYEYDCNPGRSCKRSNTYCRASTLHGLPPTNLRQKGNLKQNMLNIYVSTYTAIILTRRNCVPTGYGPSSAVGALEDTVGRPRIRTAIMLPRVKQRRVMYSLYGPPRRRL